KLVASTRWLALGPFPIQPSELIKPFLILQGAHVFSSWERLTKGERLGWLVLFSLALVGILIQPNLSTTALCGMALWFIALSAGLRYKSLLTVAMVGVGLAALSVLRNPYQQNRILSFLNPWQQPLGDGYQLSQSLLGVGSGGLIGAGYGESQLKLSYLPIQHTDFIFSVFAEEFGLLGGLFLLTFLAIFSSLAWRVAIKTSNTEHRLIAVGALILLVGQSLINIGVVVGVLPTTGLPLPFFSYGGNSMISSLFIAGLLIRVARESQNAEVLVLPHAGNGQPALIRLVGDNNSVPTARTRRTKTEANQTPHRVFLPREVQKPGANSPASLRRHRRRSLIQRIFGQSNVRSSTSQGKPQPSHSVEEARHLRIQALKKRRQHRLR
ncbi:MAG: FtsW/RodA/SpoVE family cell cycle protein, partial [Acaryochloridaceae cyanobacterium SU_2_1]|nr:FtsW/RodA/SpoVE family cell cycle protein [Acaryochloridaceae cyanobacterium SU_2_1]